MVEIKRLLLDVLKPHHPSGLELTKAIAAQGSDYRVRFRIDEVDERTETVVIEIEGSDVQFEAVAQVIESVGGSVHSVDEVVAHNSPDRE